MSVVYERCAFTGHRELGKDFNQKLLLDVIENLIQNGTHTFFCGMADGFDLEAAKCVLECKKKYNVELVACVPYQRNPSIYNTYSNLYKQVLASCDKKVVFGEKFYHGCLFERDRYMVDNADAVICYLRKHSGGTYYTVKYALSLGLKLIQV